MIAGDNDTADKLFAGINDTGEQLSPVTMTPAITFFPGIVDTSQRHGRLDSPAYISLPTPENEKYAKISALGVMYSQLSSSQKM
jgi:hypothetical protein